MFITLISNCTLLSCGKYKCSAYFPVLQLWDTQSPNHPYSASPKYISSCAVALPRQEIDASSDMGTHEYPPPCLSAYTEYAGPAPPPVLVCMPSFLPLSTGGKKAASGLLSASRLRIVVARCRPHPPHLFACTVCIEFVTQKYHVPTPPRLPRPLCKKKSLGTFTKLSTFFSSEAHFSLLFRRFGFGE